MQGSSILRRWDTITLYIFTAKLCNDPYWAYVYIWMSYGMEICNSLTNTDDNSQSVIRNLILSAFKVAEQSQFVFPNRTENN